MQNKEIDNLIEKYMQGISTASDEKKIQEYLNKTQELPKEHLAVKMMFDYYKAEKSASTNIDINEICKPKRALHKTLIIKTLSIAAAILLFISLVFVYNNNQEKQVYAYINGKAITDKEVALAATQKALITVSDNFNSGAKNLLHLQKINNAKKLVYRK